MTHPLTTHARALLAAAKCLPWRSEPCRSGAIGGKPCWCSIVLNAMGECIVPPGNTSTDVATLIAAAPTLIADLCTALDAAQGECERWRRAGFDGIDAIADKLGKAESQRDTALAEAARLRELVVEACDIAAGWTGPADDTEDGRRLATIRTEALK